MVGGTHIQAQRRTTFDTTKKTVVVTSAYKPVLRPAAKINFSAATPVVDNTAPRLQYNVPAQNLFFTYQPVSLKPLALQADTAVIWPNSNYVKAGFGNYTTPYLQAGLSFGDGTGSFLNVHTKHISQKGRLPFQQWGESEARIIGLLTSPESSHEWYGNIGFNNFNTYLYGFPDSLSFNKDQLRQRFTSFGAQAALRNKTVNAYGISYQPQIGLHLFTDNNNGKEGTIKLDAPVTKTLGTAAGLQVGLTADLTSYKPATGRSMSNNLVYITTALQYKTPNFVASGGVIPSWDNGTFKLLPNFELELKTTNESFVLMGGWKGYYHKNTYQSLATFNRWIAQPEQLLNTRIGEQFAGIKGSLGSHFTYNGRVSILTLHNAALLANDTIDGKSFVTLYEPKMNALRIHGEVGYTVQEKFSLLGGLTLSQYTGLEQNEKAWGLLPLEVNGSLRWQVLKDVYFKSDAFFWGGAPYRTEEGKSRKLNPAVDVNAGLEFAVMPRLDVWLQFNNMLNNRYQRWNRYQVLGFNVLGGVVYSF